MSKLNVKQITGYASAAGFPAWLLPTVVAIALAESSGETTAVGDTDRTNATWGPSIGLWQVRTLTQGAQKSDADKMRGTQNTERLKEPLYNAQTAYAIYKEAGSFNPWSTFKNGSFKGHLDGQGSAVDELVPDGSPAQTVVDAGQGAIDGVSALTNSLSNVNNVFGKLMDKALWQRAGLYVGGGFLIMGGLLIILLSNKEVKSVVGTTASVGAAFIPGAGAVTKAATAVKATSALRTAEAVQAGKQAAVAARTTSKAVAKGAGGAAKAAGSGTVSVAKAAGKTVASK